MKADYVHKDTLTATDYVELNKNNELLMSYNQILLKENHSLKKQLEEYKRLGFKHLNDKCNKLENQQKKFIKHMNYIIKELEAEDVDDEDLKDYIIQRIGAFKEILQKYKIIIGVSDDKTN